MERNILITGGAGFVGSSLAVRFAQKDPDNKIVCLDNLKRRGSELNLPRLKACGVRFVHGDIRNNEDLDLGDFRPDLVIECSAEPSVLAGYNSSPGYVINTNLLGTINCLEAARVWKSDFIFLSTSRVYPIQRLNSLKYAETDTRFELTEQEIRGASKDGISHEFPLEGHRSLYGATKLASEIIFEEYRMMYGMRGVVNRCGVITGPWQMGKVDQGVFVHWLGSHYFKKELAYFGYGGKGKQVRDLLHIDDLFELIYAQSENMSGVNGGFFNAGGGRGSSLSLLEATQICRELTGNDIKVKSIVAEREADVRIYISDNSHVSRCTGWSPRKGPKEILEHIFHWMRENEKELKETLFG